ncbi:MAG: MGDG synthase family glycosyltransferase, partial [Chloroflexota bacterium]
RPRRPSRRLDRWGEMSEQKRILIMTADAGFGHRSAANALAAAFKDAYAEQCLVEVVNPLDDPAAPGFLRDSQVNYDDLVRTMPDIYKLNYTISDSVVSAAVMDRALTVMMVRVVRHYLKNFQPSVVISTHPFYMSPLSSYLSLTKNKTPFVTVATDLTNVHRLWFNTGANLLVLPTDEAHQQGVEIGFPDANMQVTGIPVNPVFANEKRSKDEIRAELGWAPGMPTALVMGSKRIKGLMETMHVLNHSGLHVQFVLVAGGDDELYEQFKSTEWHHAVHIYNFVDTMPTFMRAADLVIGKAGGLSVTESMAAGLPLLISDVTPGQEEGNAAYVVEHGVGDRAEDPLAALECLFHWLDRDHALLNERAQKACALGRACSAYDIAALALQVAEQGYAPAKPGLAEQATKLKELLKTFDISLSEKHL